MSKQSILTYPAERLLSRLSLPGKIALMGSAFLAVIALLFTMFVQTQWSAIRFSSLERAGVDLVRPVPDVMLHIQRHRGLSARLGNGDESVRGALAEARAQADAAFESAASVMAEQGATLGVEPDWNAIRDRWRTLEAATSAAPADTFRAHSELLGAMLGFVSHVADTSNLTLDPDLDSFYLMDAATVQLPGLIETSAVVRGQAASIAVRKAITLDEKLELAAHMARFAEHAEALDAGLVKVAGANPVAAGHLDQMRNRVDQDAKTFSVLLDSNLLHGTSPGVDGETVFATGTRLVETGHQLWKASIEDLDQVIAARVGAMQNHLWSVSALVGALLLAVAYLFLVLRGGVARAAAGIAAGAERIAGGDLESEVRCESRDEFGAIARGLNQMRATLRDSIEKERVAALANLRIRHALDNVTIPVTVSNEHNVLVYLNQAGRALWQAMSPEIARKRPGFDADELIGDRLSDYFEDEETRSAYRAELSSARTLDTLLGGRHLRVTASPVRNDSGAYQGRITQWVDRTVEVGIEREIASIIGAVASGDFTHRVETAGKEGFFLQLAEGLNRLMTILAHSLTDVAGILNAVARGDLTQTIDAQYEGTFGQLKDDTNATVARLREVVGRILEASDTIGSAASEIATGNADLSRRTEEQASTLEETSSSMGDINATVKQNALNAHQANQLAQTANAVATHGGEVVQQVVSTMNAMQDSSRRIADIIGVIDEIAFQTNILALNAAVEAARAGVQGRGFAVVAAEVRNLAGRSAQAAKEIKHLITDSLDKVEGGAQLASQAGGTMEEIVTGFRQVAVLVDQITHASREQSSGIDQVTHAIAQMDETTQQNASLVEEAAAAAERLEGQTHVLSAAVAMFHLGGHGVATPNKAPRLPARASVRPPPSRAISGKADRAPRKKDKRIAALTGDDDEQWTEF